MGIRRTTLVNFSPSTGVNICETIVALLEDKKVTDVGLKEIPINSITKKLPADIPNNTLHITNSVRLDAMSRTLGQRSVSYVDGYIIDILYYHSELDKEDISEELAVVRDVLYDFFIRHSSLNGLSKMGILIKDPKVAAIFHNGALYRGVTMALIVPILANYNRDE